MGGPGAGPAGGESRCPLYIATLEMREAPRLAGRLWELGPTCSFVSKQVGAWNSSVVEDPSPPEATETISSARGRS